MAPPRKTHCIRGHAFTFKNTGIKTNGCKRCRRCHAIRETEKYRAKRAAILEVRTQP